MCCILTCREYIVFFLTFYIILQKKETKNIKILNNKENVHNIKWLTVHLTFVCIVMLIVLY